MASLNEKDARLTARLVEAVDQVAGGSADRLGRMLGYTNGGYIREIVNGKKPVRRMLIERFKSAGASKADPRLPAWFDEVTGGDGEFGNLSPDGWRMSLSEDPALDARSLVDDFADRLLALPADRHDAAVDACRRVAESPDSQRARQNLEALIGSAPARGAAAPADLDNVLGMLADRWPIDAEREVIQRFLDTVTQFMAESRDSPDQGSSAAPRGNQTKATTREN